MLIYFFILFFLIVLSILNPDLKMPSRAVAYTYIFFCILFIVFSGIRYDVGVDYLNYEKMYQDSIVYDTKQKEFVFAWLLHICRVVEVPFQFIMAFFSLITITLAFRFIKRYSPFIFFSILIFFCFGQYYFNTFNAVRQTLVVYLFFNSLEWIECRNWKNYFLSMVICIVAVHASAALLLPLYFILHREYSFILKMAILILSLFSMPVIIYLIEISDYAIYLKFDQFTADVSASTYFLLFLSIIFFIIDMFRGKEGSSKRLTILFNINYMSLIFLILIFLFGGTPLIMIVNRFSYYFTPVFIVLLPICIAKLRIKNNRRILIYVFTVVFSMICYASVCLNGEFNKLVPYKTIFNY